MQFGAFVDRIISGGPPLIGFDEMVNVTLASFGAVTSANEGRVVKLSEL